MPTKIVIGYKGKALQQEAELGQLVGRKIGDKVEGSIIGHEGYEFEITGGSDHCGFPMRKDVEGTNRKRILAVQGVGLNKIKKGIRVRKTVAGNTIHEKIAQVNLKTVKEGSKPLIVEVEEKDAKKEEVQAQ
ncbi:30S ribosomal protein S6e [Candidatus Woesearchaeota archaeon]|nr:30S ribosomal protein S6e [Candidatus Woesearchaeota archaeon]